MRVHKVKSCCCGCSLETGARWIGWLQIIVGILMVLSFVGAVVLFNHVNKATDEYSKDIYASLANTTAELAKLAEAIGSTATGDIAFNEKNFSGLKINHKEGTVSVARPTMSTFIGSILSGVLLFILGVILLVGTKNRRPHLLRIWILISLIGLVLYFISAIIQVVLVIQMEAYLGLVYILVPLLLGFLINYYCIMIVASLRKQIMSGNNTV